MQDQFGTYLASFKNCFSIRPSILLFLSAYLDFSQACIKPIQPLRSACFLLGCPAEVWHVDLTSFKNSYSIRLNFIVSFDFARFN